MKKKTNCYHVVTGMPGGKIPPYFMLPYQANKTFSMYRS